MNLDESQAAELFPDSREERGMESLGDFHMGIDFGGSGHVVIEVEDEQYVLTEDEKDALLEKLDCESIWGILSQKLKVLEHLRTDGT